MLFIIAARSLLQHRLRSLLLSTAIALVTAFLILLTAVTNGVEATILRSATTLMTGHVNVAGFFKVTAGQGAPVVTDASKVVEAVRREVPEIDYITQRGRGWAKLVSDTASMQVGIGGINIGSEPGFRKVLMLRAGNMDDLLKPGTLLLFEQQAKKLEVKVGDRLTISAPTPRGVNNTLDVTVVAIAADLGLLSMFNVFIPESSLRTLYQVNDETTGAIHVYLKDPTLEAARAVEKRLREAFVRQGYGVMDPDPRPFWFKFEKVNREDWTGQKLDVTVWEDEISFVKWILTLLGVLSFVFVTVLVIVVGVGIMVAVWIAIRERTREIGTLRAIGMQRGRVLVMFVTEGFLLSAVSSAAGAAVGLLTCAGLNAAQIELPLGAQLFLLSEHLTFLPTAEWAAKAVLIITACVTAISTIPSYVASRMQPITAIHHVG